MSLKTRPLSPHLQVYRLPLTGLISITHRITGVFLCLALFGVLGLGAALAGGESAFLAAQACLAAPLGQLLLWGSAYALAFHFCHGVRHLLWDLGWGFDARRLDALAKLELAASAALTGLLYFLS